MVYIIGIVAVLLIDRITKLAVMIHMIPGESLDLINGFLSLTYVENEGIAFGMFSGKTCLLAVLTAVILLVLLVFLIKKAKKLDKVMLCGLIMVIGGGIGNLIDRVLYGYVIDFIDFKVWQPVFNVADIFVCVGCGLVILGMFISGKKDDGNKGADGKHQTEA